MLGIFKNIYYEYLIYFYKLYARFKGEL